MAYESSILSFFGKRIHCVVSTTDAFATYMNYCRALAFTDLPDYAYLQRLFSGAYAELQLPMVVSFDWDELPRVPKLTFAELHHIPNTPIKVYYACQVLMVSGYYLNFLFFLSIAFFETCECIKLYYILMSFYLFCV